VQRAEAEKKGRKSSVRLKMIGKLVAAIRLQRGIENPGSAGVCPLLVVVALLSGMRMLR